MGKKAGGGMEAEALSDAVRGFGGGVSSCIGLILIALILTVTSSMLWRPQALSAIFESLLHSASYQAISSEMDFAACCNTMCRESMNTNHTCKESQK
jgi:hypothetical protein